MAVAAVCSFQASGRFAPAVESRVGGDLGKDPIPPLAVNDVGLDAFYSSCGYEICVLWNVRMKSARFFVMTSRNGLSLLGGSEGWIPGHTGGAWIEHRPESRQVRPWANVWAGIPMSLTAVLMSTSSCLR